MVLNKPTHLYKYIEEIKVVSSEDDIRISDSEREQRKTDGYIETPWRFHHHPNHEEQVSLLVVSKFVLHKTTHQLRFHCGFYNTDSSYFQGLCHSDWEEGSDKKESLDTLACNLLVDEAWQLNSGNTIRLYDNDDGRRNNISSITFNPWELNDLEKIKDDSLLNTIVNLYLDPSLRSRADKRMLEEFKYEFDTLFWHRNGGYHAAVLKKTYEQISNKPMCIPEELGGDGEETTGYVKIRKSLFGINSLDLLGQYATPHWVQENHNRCRDCDNIFTNAYTEEYGSYCNARNEWSCQDCVDEHFCYCESCESNFHMDFIQWTSNEMAMCGDCYDNRYRPIHSYDYVPQPLNFWTATKTGGLRLADSSSNFLDLKRIDRLFYGIELEVESSERRSRTEIAGDISGGERFLFCKSDGSLDNGFEIVSHPMSFEAFQTFDWNDSALIHRGDIRGFHPNSTGMHVHMSKNAFTDNHLLKFMAMVYEYKTFTHLIAQRPLVNAYNRWAKFKAGTMEIVKHRMVGHIEHKKSTIRNGIKSNVGVCSLNWGEKYSPVNISNSQTIEVRVFKSNLEEVSFRKNVEYCDALYHFTRQTPHHGLKLPAFVDYIRNEQKTYKNLNTFLDERRASLKEVLAFPLSIPKGLRIEND